MIVDQTVEDARLVAKWSRELMRLGHLYKYRALGSEGERARLREVVVDSKIWLSRFPCFNDPLDGQVVPDFGGSEREVREYWEDYVREEGREPEMERDRIESFVRGRTDDATKERIAGTYRAAMNKLGVFCLSEPRDDVPMWGYYANDQAGVCLRFSVNDLITQPLTPMKVQYMRQWPRVRFYTDSRFRKQLMACAKARAWKHEREWRIITKRGDEHRPFAPAMLDGIILGCRIKREDEAAIRAMIEERGGGIELMRASVTAGRFGISVGPA